MCKRHTGSCKIPPLLIGTSANPHCFRNQRSPIPYTHQCKAWVDKAKYRQWWFDIFLPAVREHAKNGEKVALLLDNFSGHDQLCSDPNEQVDVFFFPPNLTSIYQPLDQGIISVVKTRYKSRMLAALVNAFDDYENLKQAAATVARGRTGLAYADPPHVLDAAKILSECWNELAEKSIQGCWRRARCLPEEHQEAIEVIAITLSKIS